jgi:hypothetical protein
MSWELKQPFLPLFCDSQKSDALLTIFLNKEESSSMRLEPYKFSLPDLKKI